MTVAATAPVSAARAAVESELARILADEADRWRSIHAELDAPVRHLLGFVGRGGKRLRPAFLLAGFRAGAAGSGSGSATGDIASEALCAAQTPPPHPSAVCASAALELLHGFALIHDDVIDGSAQRRGGPSLHSYLADDHGRQGGRGESRRYGEGLAVLIGDLALVLADRTMGTALSHPSLPTRASAEARRVWDELRVELMMGEWLDVVAARSGASTGPDLASSPEVPYLVAHYKSGAYTVERPLQLGAALAGSSAETMAALSAFGRPVGVAFQLRDDLLDLFGCPEDTGKPAGGDLIEGKPTLLLSEALRRVTGSDRRLLDRVGSPDLDAGEIAVISGLLERCGARRAVEAEISRLHAEALCAIRSARLPAPVHDDLECLADLALAAAVIIPVAAPGQHPRRQL